LLLLLLLPLLKGSLEDAAKSVPKKQRWAGGCPQPKRAVGWLG
jgi:hypothetical protein